jgi:adenosylcobinamide-phosphate synthase
MDVWRGALVLAAAVLIPARLAPAALVVATGLERASRVSRPVRVMWRDHGRTASPNAGWTMAAMAGALGVALEKPPAYRLGHGPLPPATDIARGLAVVRAARGPRSGC